MPVKHARTGSHGGDTNPEDAERVDEKWVRTEANKRKSVEDDEESMVRKTMQYLKTLEKAEARKESEGLVVIDELVEFELNSEEDEWRT